MGVLEFNIAHYGAKGDGETNNASIIQKCIDTCHESGGGKIILNGGVYVSGTLYMKSKVTLEITESATLLASPNINDYGIDTHHNRYRNEPDMDRCFIYAEDQEEFSIIGRGEINGNAQAFPNKESIYRPMMFRFLRCKRIHLEKLRLFDAAAWTTAFLDSSYIWVSDVEIRNEKRYNGDGLDFDGCSHVFVRGCSITGTDDNLCLQSSSKEYKTENIHISDCEFTSLCAGIRIGLKSIGTIKNVVISNCTMKNIWREGIKIECSEGGNISDIIVNSITMNNVSRPIFILLNNRFLPEDLGNSIELKEIPQIGTMKRLIFSNIIATDDEEMKEAHLRFDDDLMGAPWFNGIRVDANENHKIQQVVFSNIMYTTVGGVKQSQIPKHYPRVYDQRIYSEKITSSNYYPDWSRATYLDIRNVEGLDMSNIIFESQYEDERKPYYIQNCTVRKQEITCLLPTLKSNTVKK